MEEKNIYLKTVLTLVLPAVVCMLSVSYWIVTNQLKTDIQSISDKEEKTLELAEKTIESTFQSVFDDVQFLRKSSYLQYYISSSSSENYKYAVDNLIEFMETRKNYYQLRYLDLDGLEKIKITKKGMDIIDDSVNRQNKSSRYYYKRATDLENQQVYISPLDLNVENGEIERPYKTVARFLMPVTNKEGIRKGYIIININMAQMLKSLKYNVNYANQSIWMVNKKRIWTIAPDGINEWFNDDAVNDYLILGNKKLGEMIETIFTAPESTAATHNDYALLSYARIDKVPGLNTDQIQRNVIVSEDFPWLLISYIPDVRAVSISGSLTDNIIRINVMLLVLFIIAAYFISRNAVRELRSRHSFMDEKTLLSNFFDNAPFSIYTKDIDGRFINVNPVSAQIMGFSTDDIKGKTVDDFYPRLIAEDISKHDREVILTNKAIEFEEVVKDENNDDQIYLSNKFPIYNHDKTIIGIGGISNNISQLRLYEKEIDEKQKVFQGVFNNAYQFIVLLDVDGKVIEVNKTALHLLDADIDELREQHFWDINWWRYSDELSKSVKTDIENAKESVLVRKEYLIRGNGDFYVDVDFTVRSVRDETNNIIYMIVEGRDISQSLADRRNIERKYLMLDAINSFQKGMFDHKNVKIAFNIFLEKTLKLTNSEYGFVGEVFYNEDNTPYLKTHAITNIAWNDETRKFYKENVQQGLEFKNLETLFGACLKTGQPVIANDTKHDPRSAGLPEGHPALNSFLGIPLYFNNDMIGMIGIANRPDGYSQQLVDELTPLLQSCGHAINSYQSITQKTQIQEQLAQSEQRMRALIDAAPDGLLMINAEGTIKLINKQVEILLGYSRHELIDASVELLIPDAIKKTHPQLRQSYMDKPVVRTLQKTQGNREVFARHKNGYSIPVEIGLSPLTIDTETYVITSLRDVTERKRLDLQLMQSQKMESVGKLTGGIAHDFNNFLGVIIGNLDLLKHLIKDNDKAISRIDKATSAALRGAELTKRLLAFSRKQTLSPKAINVNTIIEDMTEIIVRTIGSDITISKQLEDELWMCNIDPHQLENVILNMSINARDAMPSGGKLIIHTLNKALNETSQEVAGGEIAPGNYIVIDITDTGTGISKEQQDNIFEPFYTTKAEGEGTGLGLAMVYGFVKQSFGYIKLYSELGHGSSFRIFLPKIDRPIGEDAVIPEDISVDNLVGNEKLLVVDDEEMLLDVTVGQLEAAGYTIISAVSGDDALTKYEQNPDIEMVFTDIIMPGELNGVELANQIQQKNPDIKVLLTSGFPKQALDGKKGESESYNLLNKPYREIEMLESIRSILDE